MRKTIPLKLAALLSLAPLPLTAFAATEPAKDFSTSPLVTHMMAFDANHDGKLTREELTDARLYRLFDEADVNHQGFVTKDELSALAAKLDADLPAGSAGFDDGPGGGPRGFGGRGPGGPPPAPGQILPPPLARALNLTDEQKTQIADLQKEVDARLAAILTERQMRELEAGPGGPRGRGGPAEQ